LWRTNAIVFGSILFALLASTLLSAWRRVDARWSLIGVTLALCVVAYLPLRQLAPSGDLSRILYAAFICGFPVFCAGFAFADRFATRPDAERAFGWNIIGAVFGGLLEFLTMLLGLHALVPQHVAIIMDGNGRWAKQRGLPRIEGHRRGVETVRTAIVAARASSASATSRSTPSRSRTGNARRTRSAR
jgi:hypothetical protein